MTKVAKWYQKTKTWKVVAAILTPIASGEFALIFTNITLPTWIHVVVGLCAFLLLYIKMIIKDEDGDGILDHFQQRIKNERKA